MRSTSIFVLCLSLIVSGCVSTRSVKSSGVMSDFKQEKPESNRYVEVQIYVSSWPIDVKQPIAIYQTWLEPDQLDRSHFFCTNESGEIMLQLRSMRHEPTPRQYEKVSLWILNLDVTDFDKMSGHMSPYLELDVDFALKSPGFLIIREEFITRSGKNYTIMLTKQSEAPPENQRPTIQNPHRHPSDPEVLIKGLYCSVEPY